MAAVETDAGIGGNNPDEVACKKGSACDECGEGARKYTCPGCGTKTCCLACVQGHKQRSGCSGKRKASEFVAMKEFDEQQLIADYRFLEDAERMRSGAQRSRPAAPPQQQQQQQPAWLPKHLLALQRSARQRGVHLQYMQPGMARRAANSTRWDGRAKAIQWHTQWTFVAAGVTRDLPRVAEAKTLQQALESLLAPPPAGPGEQAPFLRQRQALECCPLRPYREAGLGALTVLMRKARCPANAPLFYRLSPQQALQEALSGKAVIEFPTFMVLLPGEMDAAPPGTYPIAGLVGGMPPRPARSASEPQEQHQLLPPPPARAANEQKQQQPTRTISEPKQQQQQQRAETEEKGMEEEANARREGPAAASATAAVSAAATTSAAATSAAAGVASEAVGPSTGAGGDSNVGGSGCGGVGGGLPRAAAQQQAVGAALAAPATPAQTDSVDEMGARDCGLGHHTVRHPTERAPAHVGSGDQAVLHVGSPAVEGVAGQEEQGRGTGGGAGGALGLLGGYGDSNGDNA